MTGILEQAKNLYSLEDCTFTPVSGHEGGRNQIVTVSRNGEKQYVLRISALGDRSEDDYLAETEFVRFQAENGAPVADVIPSVQGRLVERLKADGKAVYVSLFAYAKGILIADNGYRYRECAPLSEYFYNTGKALGAIHRLSKAYAPVHPRPDYFDKYNMTYLNRLIPEEYSELKTAIAKRLDAFHVLPKDRNFYGLVHFDFSDGNYHIDMDTGAITVFDFDNCMNCWYMFDLANLWIHNEGWTRQEPDPAKRFALMQQCFSLQLQGYKTETALPEEMLKNRAGAFVSLHIDGDLRGCIGTISPVADSIAEEIIANAISASTRDPRFSPVRVDELPFLEYSVDILKEPERIDSPDELDVKKYGVIVTKGMKRGLLLPNLESVDTVSEQIAIAKQKAGISINDDNVELERFEVTRHCPKGDKH